MVKTNIVMRTAVISVLAALLIGISIPGGVLSVPATGAARGIGLPVTDDVFASYADLPPLFIENQGQSPADILFYLHGQGQTVSLTSESIFFDMVSQEDEITSLSINFLDVNQDLTIVGTYRDTGVVNYLIGNDPSYWKTNIPTYKEVVYRDIYPQIDLRLYGDDGALRYDFLVKPGASVNNIALAYQGIDTLRIDDGELVATTSFGDLRQPKPHLYQQVNDQTITVEGGFTLLADNNYGFEVGQYDTGNILVIDPVLAYSTFLGGSGDDIATSVAFGGLGGHAYIGGRTTSTNFPSSAGTPGVYRGGAGDAYIAEIDTTETGAASLVYCTYVGGNGDDIINGINVTQSGTVYLTGTTTSTDFPTTAGGYQAGSGGGQDAFLTTLLPAGSGISYSTYLGGSGNDLSNGITVDPSTGIAYITGSTASTNFPLNDAYQITNKGLQDAFVAGIDPAMNGVASLIYSSYIGGSGTDISHSITHLAADWGVVIYIGGETTSTDFPTKGTPYPMQSEFWGTRDGFVAAFFPASTGSASLYFSSFLGGGGENSVTAVGICDTGCLYAIGWTDNSAFPMMLTPYQSYQGGIDTFFVRIAPSGYTQYFSTFIGGAGDDYPTGVFADYDTGTAVITGYTTSSNFPVKNAIDGTINGLKDAFVVRVNPFVMPDPDNPLHPYANFMLFGSYLGGSGDDIGRGVTLDSHGGVLIVGETTSSNFPTQYPYQANLLVARDAFISRIGEVLASVTTGDATGISATSARLNGTLIAQGTGWGEVVTQVSFEWGIATGVYTQSTAPQVMAAPSVGSFYADISGLTGGTTYYFRSKVIGDGITYGFEKTFTAAALPNTTINISVVLQGGSRPDAGWIVPLTVKFFTPGENVLTATPVYQFNVNTAKSGSTGVATITGVNPGNYDVTVVSEHTLTNVMLDVAINPTTTALNMGTLLEGNANNDNVINILDFGILAAAYGKSSGTAGYDIRADFDKSGQVNIIDFGLLAMNFSKISPVIIP